MRFPIVMLSISLAGACGEAAKQSVPTTLDAASDSASTADTSTQPNADTSTSDSTASVTDTTAADDTQSDSASADETTDTDTSTSDTTASVTDTAVSSDSQPDTTESDTTISTCVHQTFRADRVELVTNQSERRIYIEVTHQPGEFFIPYDLLEIYVKRDAFESFMAAPATYELGDDPDSCSVCVYYTRKCAQSDCLQGFKAIGGALVVDAIDPDGTGYQMRLVDATFFELSSVGVGTDAIDETVCLDSVAFEVHYECVGSQYDLSCPVAEPVCVTNNFGNYCEDIDHCESDDEREPNDDNRQGATPLLLDTPVEGLICASGGEDEYQEHDHFLVQITSPGDYYVTIQPPSGPYSMHVLVQAPTATLPTDFDNSVSYPSETMKVTLSRGYYYIRVGAHASLASVYSSGPYTLTITQTPP